MENSSYVKNSFDVYLEERRIPDPDELLGKALNYLKISGRNVCLLGFDESLTPIVSIDETSYYFDKFFGLWEHAHFTKTDKDVKHIDLSERKNKIESFYI